MGYPHAADDILPVLIDGKNVAPNYRISQESDVRPGIGVAGVQIEFRAFADGHDILHVSATEMIARVIADRSLSGGAGVRAVSPVVIMVAVHPVLIVIEAIGNRSGTGVAGELNCGTIGVHVRTTTGVNSTPNENAFLAGAAYVFVRSGTAWTQQAYLKAHQVNSNDYFGYSVAVSGDTVVVGAYGEDSSTTATPNESSSSAGAACIFTGFASAPLTPLEQWRQLHFGTTADRAGQGRARVTSNAFLARLRQVARK